MSVNSRKNWGSFTPARLSFGVNFAIPVLTEPDLVVVFLDDLDVRVLLFEWGRFELEALRVLW